MSGEGRISRAYAVRARASLNSSLITRPAYENQSNNRATAVSFSTWFFRQAINSALPKKLGPLVGPFRGPF